MHPLASRRARAYLLDCMSYLGVAVATVPIGVVLNRRGLGGHRGVALLVSAVPPVAATVIAARQEAGPRHATSGKQRYGLVVVDTAGSPLTGGRTLLRNLVKIGVPWQLGHVVAIGSSFGGFRRRDPLTWVAAVVVYPLLAAMVVAAGWGGGRALHDRAARTGVRTAPDTTSTR